MASNYSRHKAALPPGARLRQYAIRRVLGVGGFGITYLATDGDLQTQVAIKEYLPNEFAVREGEEAHPKSPESQKAFRWGLSRFLQEGRELAKFRHPHIVRVHQMFEANNTAYMVLDYEGGDTLEKWLLGLYRKPTEAELQHILLPLLDALEHIHQGGLLHRDISPDNIIIRKNGAPVLLDFGSARYATAVQSKTLSTLIKAGYSPPEQYSSRGRQGAYTDIYALAATLYRAITGKAPPEGSWRVAEVAGGDGDPLPPLQEAGYSADFLSAIESALAVSAANRPQNIAEWRQMFNFSAGAEAQTEFAQQPTQETPEPQLVRVSFGEETKQDFSFQRKPKPFEKKKKQTPAPSVAKKKGGKFPTKTTFAFLFIAFIAWMFVPWDANSQYERGVRYYDEGSYQSAAKWWNMAAEQGHARAQYSLGQMYENGRGVEQNDQEAAKWYLESSKQGNVDAQKSLGWMYINGRGVKQSDKEAAKWWRGAAVQGDAYAQYTFGWMYENGRGVQQSDQVAAQWYLKAAKQGNIDAQSNLGIMYENGRGVEQNDQEAVKWYQRAAEQGDADAQYKLGLMYGKGQGVEQNDKEAVKWWREAAKQGESYAQFSLGWMYANGRGVKQDYKEAVKWYRQSAEQGNEYAQSNLGDMYANGQGVEQNDQEAVKWYQRAAEQGDLDAQNVLGWMYANGRGVKQDYKEAVKRYRQAAEQGHADAKFNLGMMYHNGQGVKQNDKEAVKWWREATEQGNSNAQYRLGWMYRDGRGVKKQSDKEAVSLWRESAEQRNAYAQFSLGWMYANGRGVKQDDKEAAQWYLKAAGQGHENAQNALGVMYQNGRGVKQDNKEAARWYLNAAEQGNAYAQFNLGWMYEYGRGVRQDDKEAAQWYLKAAEQGHAYAQGKLGVMYQNGRGVKQSHQDAVSWHQKAINQESGINKLDGLYDAYLGAAERGLAQGQFGLGEIYENGWGVKQDRQEAIKWYQKAAEQGHYLAIEKLDLLRENKRWIGPRS